MSGVPATAPAPAPQKLDELMLAMDVVDTLRHQETVVARELAEADRAAGLKERLRDIYRGQGIEVPDRIIEDGIKALKESRFVYTPPAPGTSVTLARLWVRRRAWGRRTLIATAALIAAVGVYIGGVRWPAERAAEQARVELSQTLPRQLQAAHQAVRAEARVDPARQRADTLLAGGQAAVARGDAASAREVVAELDRLTLQLRREYTLRIAGRADEQTGLTREPTNASGRRWFIVVNAIDAQNRPSSCRSATRRPTGSRRCRASRSASPARPTIPCARTSRGTASCATTASARSGAANST